MAVSTSYTPALFASFVQLEFRLVGSTISLNIQFPSNRINERFLEERLRFILFSGRINIRNFISKDDQGNDNRDNYGRPTINVFGAPHRRHALRVTRIVVNRDTAVRLRCYT